MYYCCYYNGSIGAQKSGVGSKAYFQKLERKTMNHNNNQQKKQKKQQQKKPEPEIVDAELLLKKQELALGNAALKASTIADEKVNAYKNFMKSKNRFEKSIKYGNKKPQSSSEKAGFWGMLVVMLLGIAAALTYVHEGATTPIYEMSMQAILSVAGFSFTVFSFYSFKARVKHAK